MSQFSKQTITLSAICQVASAVQKIARQGSINDIEFSMLLKSIIVTSPNNTLEVYNGELENLKQGFYTLINQLGNESKNKDPEVTRYVVSLLSLERRLSKNSKKLSELSSRINQCQRQLEHYHITSETLVSSLASIYSDTISPLGTPIQVAGNPEFLKKTSHQHQIRALLLAGMRSAVLWRQVGGKRRNIFFARSKLVECAQQLLKQI